MGTDAWLSSGLKVILAVSQTVGGDVGADEPDRDFSRLAKLVGGEVCGNSNGHVSSLVRSIEKRTALDFGQALHVLRTYPDADAYLSFSERVGIPLGMLLRSRKNRPAHILIAHRLNTRAKRLLHSLAGWGKGIDRILVICESQLEHAERFAPGLAYCMRAGVTDSEFYTSAGSSDGGYILSVGSESRDYDTLLGVASRLSTPVKVLCSSTWARRSSRGSCPSPSSVEFLARVSYSELRALYDGARVVVVPLQDVDYAAGHNAVLEAFCMAKPVVVTGTRGIVDYVRHGHSAIVVPPGDPGLLAEALDRVCRDSELRVRLGTAGRAEVDAGLNLSSYTEALAAHINETVALRRSR